MSNCAIVIIDPATVAYLVGALAALVLFQRFLNWRR